MTKNDERRGRRVPGSGFGSGRRTARVAALVLALPIVALATLAVVGSASAVDVANGGSVLRSAGAIDHSIDAFIDREMPASGVPGLAYAVVDEGRLVAAGERGVVLLGDDAKVTPDTPFLVGSVSKSFTALAVMQLVERGEIDLDAEIAEYLLGFAGQPAGSG